MKTITNILAVASALLISMPAMAKTSNKDTLVIAEKMPYFDQIEVSNIEVMYIESDKSSITLYQEDVEAKVNWEVKGSTLVITREPEEGGKKRRHIKIFGIDVSNSHDYGCFFGQARLVVTGPVLEGCIHHGHCSFETEKMSSDHDINVITNGSGSVKIGTIKAPRVGLTASGACTINTSIETQELTASASGASIVMITGDCPEVQAIATGASNVLLDGNYEQMSGDASGASNISVNGSVKHRKVHTSGASGFSVQK